MHPLIQSKFQKLPVMKNIQLLIAIATLPLVGACTTVREDPRSLPPKHTSLYQNTSAVSGGSGSGKVSPGTETRTSISEPQLAPIPARAGTQPTKYLNTTSPYDAPASTSVSPYDRPGSASPLRHDTPDNR